jgi:hypothetical protein
MPRMSLKDLAILKRRVGRLIEVEERCWIVN